MIGADFSAALQIVGFLWLNVIMLLITFVVSEKAANTNTLQQGIPWLVVVTLIVYVLFVLDITLLRHIHQTLVRV